MFDVSDICGTVVIVVTESNVSITRSRMGGSSPLTTLDFCHNDPAVVLKPSACLGSHGSVYVSVSDCKGNTERVLFKYIIGSRPEPSPDGLDCRGPVRWRPGLVCLSVKHFNMIFSEGGTIWQPVVSGNSLWSTL